MDTDDETDETSKNDDDGKSDKDEEEVIKVQRKKLETKKKAVKRKMAEAIIDAHEKARASTSADTEDVVEIDNSASTIEAPPLRLLLPNNLNLNNEANLTVGTKRSDLIYLGEGEWIREVAYNKSKSQVKPSLFVTKLAYALWGYEQLANRSVAHIEGRENRPLLEENKKLVVINQFERYLRHRDKMTQTVEMKKVNAYLGGAIKGARGKIARRNRKRTNSENDSDENN
ncbi:uncharacterized protein [Chelonus insularis]|uniref:uncharacterized protein n=1 Tax=Chelonus insularis TaxID=460826 RepID=UPI001589BEBD|nr:uncharacterized protein LOC118071122 [Chelonus insularis]